METAIERILAADEANDAAIAAWMRGPDSYAEYFRSQADSIRGRYSVGRDAGSDEAEARDSGSVDAAAHSRDDGGLSEEG